VSYDELVVNEIEIERGREEEGMIGNNWKWNDSEEAESDQKDEEQAKSE
jgi:hypothetical protein